jgi:hypothetical protein
MALACGHTTPNRGVISIPVGRKFAITAPVDCWISISTAATGDALLSDFHFAWIRGGIVYVFIIPLGSPPVFLSGLTVDPNGDVAPTQLTFIDSGASPI